MVFKTESRQQPRKFCQKTSYDKENLVLLKMDEENRPLTEKKVIRFFRHISHSCWGGHFR